MIETYPFFLMKHNLPYRFEVMYTHTHEYIALEARASDDLSWDRQLADLEACLVSQKKVMIYLDLGLTTSFAPFHEISFSSYIMAIEQFNKRVASHFCDIIEGVIFYQGSCHLEHIVMIEDEDIDEHIHENLKSIYDVSMQKRLAACSILGTLIHRLVAFLDERIPAFLIFEDAKTLSPIDQAVMFSKERFDHLFVAADISDYQYTTVDLGRGLSSIGYISEGKSSEISEIKRGVLLPSDASMNRVSYEYLKNFMEILSQKGVSYRMIAEKIFNECWNDIDEVHYEENAIHPMTLRMVKGFVASGGVALTIPS